MKQLVMDYDKVGRIKKTWLWVCDKGGHKVISDKLPQEWSEEKSLVVCKECK